jgi:hypothetical protein
MTMCGKVRRTAGSYGKMDHSAPARWEGASDEQEET